MMGALWRARLGLLMIVVGMYIVGLHRGAHRMSNENPPLPAGLADLVLRWVQENGRADATQVISMVTQGTDWAGSTEEGFHYEASTDIEYLRADGKRGYYSVEGGEMGKLWNSIIASWPSDPPPSDPPA